MEFNQYQKSKIESEEHFSDAGVKFCSAVNLAGDPKLNLHDLQVTLPFSHRLSLQQHSRALTNISLFIYRTNLPPAPSRSPQITTLQISPLTRCRKHNMKLSVRMLTPSSYLRLSAPALMKAGELYLQTQITNMELHVSERR